MRRLLVPVLLLGVTSVLPAAPASATVHPLSCSERSAAPAGTPAATQNPPGITQPPHPGSGPDSSHAATAQPIVAMFANSTDNDLNAFKPPGC